MPNNSKNVVEKKINVNTVYENIYLVEEMLGQRLFKIKYVFRDKAYNGISCAVSLG